MGLTPHRGQNGAVEPGLLADVLARFFQGALGAFGHVPDLERFEDKELVALITGQGVTGLMGDFAAHIDPVAGMARHPAFGLLAPVRADDAARQSLLPALAVPGLFVDADKLDVAQAKRPAITGRQRDIDAPVQAKRLAQQLGFRVLHQPLGRLDLAGLNGLVFAAKRDMPAPGVDTDVDGGREFVGLVGVELKNAQVRLEGADTELLADDLAGLFMDDGFERKQLFGQPDRLFAVLVVQGGPATELLKEAAVGAAPFIGTVTQDLRGAGLDPQIVFGLELAVLLVDPSRCGALRHLKCNYPHR